MTHFDVTIFGATSFVGSLVVHYLAETAPAGAKVALAGRNAEKIRAVRDALPASAREWPIVIADAHDSAQMRDLAQNTRVVLTTVGPYARYGNELVDACAQAGTHYLDLAGEALFVRDSIERNHEQARESGAAIIHSCGFDSVPSDLALFELFRRQGRVGDCEMKVLNIAGGLSGGTVASMMAEFERVQSLKGAARKKYAGPLVLAPGEKTTQKLPATGIKKGYSPFLMAVYNARLIRRSAQLLDYGELFEYREYQRVEKRTEWAVLSGGLALGAVLLKYGAGRRLAQRFLPQPGEGPSEEQMAVGHFEIVTTDLSTGESVRVALDRDPGYRGTALMIGEAAWTLIDDNAQRPIEAGVLTPASGLGEPYMRRLRKAGMLIE